MCVCVCVCVCQIVVGDLWAAYGYKTCSADSVDAVPLGAFHDIHELTMFGAPSVRACARVPD